MSPTGFEPDLADFIGQNHEGEGGRQVQQQPTFRPDWVGEDLPPSPRTTLRGAPLRKRLEALIEKRGPASCWPWKGPLDPRGYGRIQHEGRTHLVHRLIRKVRAGYESRNTCGFRSCCNPAHWEVKRRGSR